MCSLAAGMKENSHSLDSLVCFLIIGLLGMVVHFCDKFLASENLLVFVVPLALL